MVSQELLTKYKTIRAKSQKYYCAIDWSVRHKGTDIVKLSFPILAWYSKFKATKRRNLIANKVCSLFYKLATQNTKTISNSLIVKIFPSYSFKTVNS